ncbi:MAG: molybdate ABC transporter substrate-binding protein [Lachnospiraceae bacterium]|jgi:molybdate transport system substrate-binding protein|nr:molybdate ABC transporter substrate-binding protein [Lachnospiraceae bacterium]
MRKKIISLFLVMVMISSMLMGCKKQQIEITLFAAKSLNPVMEELIKEYNKTAPNIKVQGNYDSSGTLMNQIEEGAPCDVFFSAAVTQMDQLQDKKLIDNNSRLNVVKNKLCLVTYKGSNTKVTSLKDIYKAKSFALANASVPVGKYTRIALGNLGILKGQSDTSKYTSTDVSKAFKGIDVNDCNNVGAVASAVAEGSNEVGTVYYSDIYGYEKKLKVIEEIPYDLTGIVVYPVARVKNKDANEERVKAASNFVKFLISKKARIIFDKYHFDTNVEKELFVKH